MSAVQSGRRSFPAIISKHYSAGSFSGMSLESLIRQTGGVPAEMMKSLNAALRKIRK